jgi:hypothetical protein
LSKNDVQSRSQPFGVSLDASPAAVDGPGLREKN